MTSDHAPLPSLPRRPRDAHKGAFGRVLVIAGSRGMSGAAALAGKAALRGGAGLVRVATPEICLEAVAAQDPCYTTVPLPCDGRGQIALEAAGPLAVELAEADVAALGPGLGRSSELSELVRRIYETAVLPMVVDADGLNALSDEPLGAVPAGPRVLTPHPGEFQRLTQIAPGRAQRDAGPQFALQRHCVLVLKGHQSLVTDGHRTALNGTGNPGMATGGSGDVLTGVIAALLAQGLDPWAAARLGAHVHGLAGDMAASRCGETSLIATDLLDFLPAAFLSLEPT